MGVAKHIGEVGGVVAHQALTHGRVGEGGVAHHAFSVEVVGGPREGRRTLRAEMRQRRLHLLTQRRERADGVRPHQLWSKVEHHRGFHGAAMEPVRPLPVGEDDVVGLREAEGAGLHHEHLRGGSQTEGSDVHHAPIPTVAVDDDQSPQPASGHGRTDVEERRLQCGGVEGERPRERLVLGAGTRRKRGKEEERHVGGGRLTGGLDDAFAYDAVGGDGQVGTVLLDGGQRQDDDAVPPGPVVEGTGGEILPASRPYGRGSLRLA